MFKSNDIYLIFQSNSEFLCIYNKYILIVNGENFSNKTSKIFNSYISEFANFKSNSDVLISKIKEFYKKTVQKKH